MNIKFDKETDAVYLRFSDSEIKESDEEKPGIIIDYDKEGGIVGIDFLRLQKRWKSRVAWFMK